MSQVRKTNPNRPATAQPVRPVAAQPVAPEPVKSAEPVKEPAAEPVEEKKAESTENMITVSVEQLNQMIANAVAVQLADVKEEIAADTKAQIETITLPSPLEAAQAVAAERSAMGYLTPAEGGQLPSANAPMRQVKRSIHNPGVGTITEIYEGGTHKPLTLDRPEVTDEGTE